MLSTIRSAAILGIDAYAVDVEVDISSGLPAFNTVGLPHGAVKEGRERVSAALDHPPLANGNGRVVHYVTGDPTAFAHTAETIAGVEGEIVPLPVTELSRVDLPMHAAQDGAAALQP